MTRSILDAALDCIVVLGVDGRVVEWNAAAEQTFGYSREGATGRPLGELIVPPELQAHQRGLARYLATGAAHVLGRRLEPEAVRADGSRLPVELAITRLDAVRRCSSAICATSRGAGARPTRWRSPSGATGRSWSACRWSSIAPCWGPAGRWTYVSPQIGHMTGFGSEEWMADPEYGVARARGWHLGVPAPVAPI